MEFWYEWYFSTLGGISVIFDYFKNKQIKENILSNMKLKHKVFNTTVNRIKYLH